MINIVLKGVDEFLGSHVETALSPQIAKILKVDGDEILFVCLHSMIYHGGIDQTSYHMIVTVELDEKYREKERELAEYILEASRNFSVHCHLGFIYLASSSYARIEKDYPLFVTASNEVEIKESEEDEEEIYLGDVFADFDRQMKERK